MKSNNMEQKKRGKKSMTFRDAIWLALHTPHLTHKQLDELRKKEKLKKQQEKKK